jgi:hypothetical protein
MKYCALWNTNAMGQSPFVIIRLIKKICVFMKPRINNSPSLDPVHTQLNPVRPHLKSLTSYEKCEI